MPMASLARVDATTDLADLHDAALARDDRAVVAGEKTSTSTEMSRMSKLA